MLTADRIAEKPVTSYPNNQNTMQHNVVSERCQSSPGSSSSSSSCDSSCYSDSASSVSSNDSFSEDCDDEVKYKAYVPDNKAKIREEGSEKCKLQCSTKFSEEDRKILYSTYWDFEDLEK
ncbi:hypothetical protein PR048_022177 [Dryococelus australis]|uniref:Uncharacterized protein n=1 Tax=Dryococelus australis TaxID=614101 RepID=A0ABQ9H0D3_9NEOP|nr:hypothetical protein PR048_022177 [Dryococelus australis]